MDSAEVCSFLDKNVVDSRWLVLSKMLVGTNNRPKLNLVIVMPF